MRKSAKPTRYAGPNALNEIVTDGRFLALKSVTPLEVAEHILQQEASGERDLSRLKSSAFEKLSTASNRATDITTILGTDGGDNRSKENGRFPCGR